MGMLVLATLVTGFIGGTFSSLVFVGQNVIAQESQQPGIPGTMVVAEEFRLVNKEGHVRAKLTLWDGELPALVFGDGTCHTRAMLGIFNGEQPALILSDKDCQERAGLDMQPDGLPGLTLRDKENVPRVWIKLLKDGSPIMDTFNEKGEATWSVPSSAPH